MAMLRPGPTIIDYLLVSIDFGDNDNYQLSFGDNLSEPSLRTKGWEETQMGAFLKLQCFYEGEVQLHVCQEI
jgi:hypothetical protein